MSFEVKLNEESENRFEYIASKVKTELKNDKERKIIIIVPDQFNFACQKLMFDKLDTKVISQLEILSFKRLIYRTYEEVNYFKEGISNIERLSLLTNIVEDKKKELKFFGKYSITDKIIIEINNLMSLINKNIIDVDNLKTFNVKNETILTNKVNDVATIYTEYASRMLSMNCDIDIITPLKEVITNCKMINNASIYVSEFYNFTNEQIEILKILEKNDAKITLIMQANKDYALYDKGVFAPCKNILEKMNINQGNIEYLEYKSKKNNDLEELKKIYMINNYLLDNKLDKVSINAYTSKEREVFNVCLKIRDLINKGYRYKDICVAIKNYDLYELKIHNFFDAFGIPYYQENQKKLANAKVVRTIIKMFEMMNSNYNNEKIMSFIKENMFMKLYDINIYNFDNFVLETGIEYYDTLKKKYDSIVKETNKDKIKQMTKCDVKYLAKAFDFIEKIRTDFAFKPNTKYEVSKLNTYAINMLTDLVKSEFIDNEDKETEKIVNVFDKWNKCEEKELTLDEYLTKFKILIEDISVSRVDETLDMVYVYDCSRVNFLSTKVLILCGYSNSASNQSRLTNLFSDKESEKLNSYNIEFNKKFKDQILEERFLFFNMIEKAQEELMINYTMFEDDNKVEISNDLIKLNLMSDKLNKVHFDDEYIVDNLLISDEAIIKFVYTKINEFELNKDIIKKTLTKIKDKKQMIELFDYAKENNIVINDDITELNLSYSAIEKYMDCPFSYFMLYKLGVKERNEMKYDAARVGNIAHEVFEKFFNKVASNEINTKNITEDEIKEEINIILNNEVGTEFLHDDKGDITVERYKDILFRNLSNFITQINNGEFNVKYNELEFGKGTDVKGIEFVSNDGVRVYLGGKIDRIDTIEEDDKIYLRVIDYKTGEASFDATQALQGKNMQLIIYLKILLDKYKNENKEIIPAGLFLAKINKDYDRIVDYSLSDNKLDGVVNADRDIMAKIDKDYKNSSIINVKFKVNDEIHSNSINKVRDSKELEDLANKSVDVTKEYSEKIISGIMDVKEDKNFEEGKCIFCPYKTMCSINE